jgi:protein-S-isoprenylcysteine O-methyltransferase Ste14
MAERGDTVGIGLPAPGMFAGAFLIGLGLNWIIPRVTLPQGIRMIGWGLVCFGIAGIGLPALVALLRAGTTPSPVHPTTALVVTGPYRFTRHPMYLSMTVVYVGAALAANVLWTMLLLPVAMILTDRGPMAREERYMEQRFGDAYRRYKAQVRRWI